ncbi:hypothetical protein GJ744_010226 [Endocarpon pusillum]|uniref:Uncharacterized protein n=1 Tax=Endocarpon pusillum TaxID=364733 RepID=A0A8H7E4B7_9EURO|nr:hypothetical protein GJ744_010226 [Endocarpon pusillum]
MQAVLKSLPIDLHDLFARCFENIHDPCATRALILWVLFAERSLAPAELECALLFSNEVSYDSFRLLQGSVDDRGNYEQLGKRIKHLSKGLVEIQNVPIHPRNYRFTEKDKVQPRVQFIHESARDFLLQYNGLRMIDTTLGTSPIPRSHDFLARACMRYLKMKEFQWFRESSRFEYKKDTSRKIGGNEVNHLRETYPFSEYAVQFVFKHASEAEKGGIFPVHLNHSFGGNQGQVFLTWRHLDDMMNHVSFVAVQGPETALMHVVAEHGILSCLIDLLNEGVPVNLNGGRFSNVLIAASWAGNPKMVRILLDRGADITAFDKYHGNALQAAAAGGHMDVVQKLLDYGADINAQGGYYGNALQAAAAGGHMDVVRMLFDYGADINTQGGHYVNTLQAAATRGHMDMVQMLLDHGADINAQGGYLGNALQAAAAGGYMDMMRMLLDCGADINASGGLFGSALSAAAEEGHMDVVQMLLDHGADINAQGGHLGNALQAAATRGHMDMMRMLLDCGADINASGGPGGLYYNALQAAAQKGHMDVVQMLLDRGADINAQGDFWGNALQAAAAEGHPGVVRILLDRGADITVQGGYYGNALQAAASRGHQDVVKMLEDHSTKVSAEG